MTRVCIRRWKLWLVRRTTGCTCCTASSVVGTCSWSAIRTTRARRDSSASALTAAGFPEVWDAMRNEISAVPFQRQGETVELELTLEPS